MNNTLMAFAFVMTLSIGMTGCKAIFEEDPEITALRKIHHSVLVTEGSPEAKTFSAVFKVLPQPYHPGEKLLYSFKFKGITAGRAVLSVLDEPMPFNGHKVIKLDALIETNKFASLFYSLSNHSYSLVDAEKGFSRFFHINLKEERVKYTDTVKYDYDKAVGTNNRLENSQNVTADFPLYGPVVDVTSMTYYFRHLSEFAVGDIIDVPLSTAKDVYLFKMVVERKGLINVRDIGTVKALNIMPLEGILNGPAITKTGTNLWIEETTHIPLRITLELSKGSMTMYLVNLENVANIKALDSKQIKAARKDGYR